METAAGRDGRARAGASRFPAPARPALRGIPALLAALLLCAACLAFGAAPAAADPLDACTPTKGAVVAVDFGPFGGPVERGCDATPTTGYALLHEAGFTTEGTQHDGPAFLCRIGGAFDSGTRYPTEADESCVLTPSASAYWSYWTASPGQDAWTYSPYGAVDRKPKDGDVDAWVFGGTDVGGSTGKPDFTPDEVRAGSADAPGGGPGTDPGPPEVPAGDIDVPAAAAWLRGVLKDGERVVVDGSPDVTLTTEAAYALAAAGGDAADLGRITGFLTAHTDDYAYPAGAGHAPDASAAARLALLAEATGADPHHVGGHDLIGDLAGNVCAAGPASGGPTPGCTAEGDFQGATYAEGQALSVLALLRAGARPPSAAVDRLVQAQCDDGGITGILIRPGEYCDGDPATTGLAALVLREAGGRDAAVADARAYLRAAQRPDGSFPGWTGATAGSVTASAYAAQALRALGDTGRADAAVSWLSRQQRDGGGFGFEEGATGSAVRPTAPAVLAGAATDLTRLTAQRPDPAGPGGGPTTPAGGGPDLKKGVAYLTGAANLTRGQYYAVGPGVSRADFGLTIDGAYALAATGLGNDALRSVVDFLDHGGKDGDGRTVHDWTGAGTAYAAGGSLGKTALLAESVGRDPRSFGGKDLIAALEKAVCDAPSTGPDRSCAAEGAYTYAPSVFAQSLAVMAQLRAGERTAAGRPLAYLESLQSAGGAWPSLIPSTNDGADGHDGDDGTDGTDGADGTDGDDGADGADGADGDVDSTAIAAMALGLAGGDTAKAAVDRALAWIAGRQLPDGGFPGAAGNSVNSAALAVQGLSLDKAAYAPQIARARTFLASQQNSDGGFTVAEEGQRGSDLRASTQAVGGATGISFGVLERDLSGTTPGPGPSTPPIVTPGDTSGGGGAVADGPGGGALASTGARVGLLAALAAVLVGAGRRTVVVARRPADPGERA